MANQLPAAIIPPLVNAIDDMSLAAMEPAAIPVEVKPRAARAAGVKATVTTPPAQERRRRNLQMLNFLSILGIYSHLHFYF